MSTMDELIELPLALGDDGAWGGVTQREHRQARIRLSEIAAVGEPQWGHEGGRGVLEQHHFSIVLKTSGALLRVEVHKMSRMSFSQDFDQLCAIRQQLIDRINASLAPKGA